MEFCHVMGTGYSTGCNDCSDLTDYFIDTNLTEFLECIFGGGLSTTKLGSS